MRQLILKLIRFIDIFTISCETSADWTLWRYMTLPGAPFTNMV